MGEANHGSHMVTWMTRLLRVNGHRSSELSLFLNIEVNGHVLIALLLSLLLSYSEFLFLKLGRRYLSSRGWAINQPRIDVEEVNPNFLMAPLICTPDAKRIVRDFEGTMHANMPLSLGHRWLDKSAKRHPIRLVHHLVPTAVGGPAEQVSTCWQRPPRLCHWVDAPLPDWRRHVEPCQPVLETLQYGL